MNSGALSVIPFRLQWSISPPFCSYDFFSEFNNKKGPLFISNKSRIDFWILALRKFGAFSNRSPFVVTPQFCDKKKKIKKIKKK